MELQVASGSGDAWDDGDEYESYMGRWSRPVATDFVRWLGIAPGGLWLDVGCGTGALTSAVVEEADPFAVSGVDPSAGFLEYAAGSVDDSSASFELSDAESLPFDDDLFDVAVSGLVLDFLPDSVAAVREQVRVVRSSGTIAAYVWDYAEGMLGRSAGRGRPIPRCQTGRAA
jgi:ubiquinone/menaquinone biosynthesis C-methylase UbiE